MTVMDARLVGRTVLLAEDDWLISKSLAGAFTTAGCTVFAFSGGEDAVTLLAHNTAITLLVTDIALAGTITGWDLAEYAHAQNPLLPVVYASGSKPIPARQVPGSCFVSKPYTSAAVLRICADLLGARRAAAAV